MWSLVGCVLPLPCLYFLSWFFLCHAPLKQKCLKIISMETCNNSRWVYVPRFEFSVWAASLVDLQMCCRCSPCEQHVGAAKEVQTAAPQKSNDPHEDADFSFCSACQPRRFASPVNSSANSLEIKEQNTPRLTDMWTKQNKKTTRLLQIRSSEERPRFLWSRCCKPSVFVMICVKRTINGYCHKKRGLSQSAESASDLWTEPSVSPHGLVWGHYVCIVL